MEKVRATQRVVGQADNATRVASCDATAAAAVYTTRLVQSRNHATQARSRLALILEQRRPSPLSSELATRAAVAD